MISLDVILELIIGILAVYIAVVIFLNKKQFSNFSGGFVLIAIASILDVIDEFIDHILFDVGSKGLFALGLFLIILVFYKLGKAGNKE